MAKNISKFERLALIAAQGGEFAGWSLFVKDGRLVYEHNFLGLERYRVVSSEKIPAGAVRLGMEFLVTGKYEIAPDLTAHGIEGFKGRVALYINDRPAGSGEIEKTVPFGWSLTRDGLCCGFDTYQNTAKERERAFLIE